MYESLKLHRKQNEKLQTKVTIILVFGLIIFKNVSLLNNVKKQKVKLQIIVTIIQAFTIVYVFAFIKIFIYIYDFQLLSNVILFYPAGLS